MSTATQPRIARLKMFLAELNDGQRRMFEIRTGVPFVAPERNARRQTKVALDHLFTDEVGSTTPNLGAH